jgi:glucan phosphoethanolaminetransferase (alkaline phosphatase superfamily)
MKHSENIFQKATKFFTSPATWVWLFALLLLVPNLALCVTERVSLLSKLTNILLPLGIYLTLISLSKKIGRTLLLFIPVCVFCAFQIVLLFLYGESIIAIDMFMNVVTTNPSEAGELLGNLRMALAVVFVCYLPPIIYGIYAVVKKQYAPKTTLLAARKWGITLAVLGVICLFAARTLVDRYNARREIFPYNVLANLVTTVQRAGQAANYYETSANFSYNVTTTHPNEQKEVYVFIIGETSRADNWQIFGYGRETNPRLSKRSNITTFSRTLSEINTTHKSVPMLLSYLNADNFGDSVASSRSIFAAFNDCDYETAFISNQRRNHSYIDFYGEEAQTALFLTDEGEVMPDLDLVQSLKDFISQATSNKLFIVLHTYGSHFEYRNRYSSDMAYFTPESNSDASLENREQLLNAYDNTIRYTDAVIDSIIATLADLNTLSALVYTSDHGEDIFDDSRGRFLHASPVPTYWQLHVPMLVWLSQSYADTYPGAVSALRANSNMNVSSTSAAFNTLLDLAGLRSPYLDQTQSLISPTYKPAKRRYLNDYNESVDLQHCGFRDQDFTQLRAHSIAF